MAYFPVVGAIIVLLVRRNIADSSRWLASKGRLDEADSIVRRTEAHIERLTGMPLAEPIAAADAASAARSTFSELFHPPHRARMLMLIVSTSASSIAYVGFAHWTPTLLASQGVSVTKSLLYTAFVGFAYLITPLITAMFADRVERKWQIAAGGLITAVAGLLFVGYSLGGDSHGNCRRRPADDRAAVRISEQQRTRTQRYRDLEAYVLYKFKPALQLRVSVSNALGEDYRGDSRYDDAFGRGQTLSNSPRPARFQANLELKF